jgi:hypothetical protein
MEDQLHLFSAGSMNNEAHKYLWVKGAALFIPQLNRLLNFTRHQMNIFQMEHFQNDCTTLGNLFESHRSDKSTTHNYHIKYSYIINQLGGPNAKINLLEIGLGTNNQDLISSMGWNGNPGASLYAFRDYLPNANIYGCDIDRAILFESDRIKTCYVDQMEATTFDGVSEQFGKDIKYDLIIDDGLHSICANLNTLLFALDHVADNGWIVIEDVQKCHITNWNTIDFILSSIPEFKCYSAQSKSGGYMYIIHKLIVV